MPPIDYSKWSSLHVDDEDDDRVTPPSRDASPPIHVPSPVDDAKLHSFVHTNAQTLSSFAAVNNDDAASERQLIANAPILLDPLAARHLFLRAVDLHSSGKMVQAAEVTRQYALLSMCDWTRVSGMSARNAVAQVFSRMRSDADDGPHAEARRAFELHLASCVAAVRQHAAANVSSLAKLEAVARGGGGGGGSNAAAGKSTTESSKRSSCCTDQADCCSVASAGAGSGGNSWRQAFGCYGASVFAGLLGSSCCLLQLILNTMAVGCAGFNKVLGGRARTPLRIMSAGWLLSLWAWTIAKKRRRCARANSALLHLLHLLHLLLSSSPSSSSSSSTSTTTSSTTTTSSRRAFPMPCTSIERQLGHAS